MFQSESSSKKSSNLPPPLPPLQAPSIINSSRQSFDVLHSINRMYMGIKDKNIVERPSMIVETVKTSRQEILQVTEWRTI